MEIEKGQETFSNPDSFVNELYTLSPHFYHLENERVTGNVLQDLF